MTEGDYDPSSLESWTQQEITKCSTELLRLHKKLGHPSRQAFVKMLKDRGATLAVRTLATNIQCQDCHESSVPPSRRATTLERAVELWEVIQVDNFEFTVGDLVYHFQLIIDEASNYAAVNYFFNHPTGSRRTPNAQECLHALHQGWIQHFGYPKCIKLDKEGPHRGKVMEEWASSHGVEVTPIAAEDHGQIGQVERLVGTLKRKVLTHLRSSEVSPELATWGMMAAHNTLSNVGGYTPCQWIFGKNPTDAERLHEAGELPYWASMTEEERFNLNLQVRYQAEDSHRQFNLNENIKRAANSRVANGMVYYPGDIVYFKRYQAPSDKRLRAHQELDVPRRRIARWYGPARVLALETRSTYEGQVRQPHGVAWIVVAGRLKKVNVLQLRMASERERVIAETTIPLATPWTWNDITGIINRGEYDEETTRVEALEKEVKELRRGIQRLRQRDLGPTGHPLDEEMALAEPRGTRRKRDEEVDELEEWDAQVDELLRSVPGEQREQGPLFKNELFMKQRRKQEALETQILPGRHAHLSDQPEQSASQEQAHSAEDPEQSAPMRQAHLVEEDAGESTFQDYVFSVNLPEPRNEHEWRAIVKDPSKFVAKKVAKGVEVAWHKLNSDQRRAMAEAKQVEIKSWIAQQVVKAALGDVPRERLMKMRWVLTFKPGSKEGEVKAKARLVVLGFTDPDVGLVETRSPTSTRRGRQVLLQLATHRKWPILKADAKAAFLQGQANQEQRGIFGMPVEELREALEMPRGQAVQFLKAAYGLTIAPREFYVLVDETVKKLGLTRMTTEPCMWVCRVPEDGGGDGSGDKLKTVGVIAAHVDDFLICGDETHPAWSGFIERFGHALQWSPWEVPPMMHCGVKMQELPHGGWRLDQEEYCAGLSEVQTHGTGKELTAEERQQCRAVLGAAQWRVYQTGPAHAARLSHLQSLPPKADQNIIPDINRFVRELYNQRTIGLEIHDLKAKSDDDLVVIGWSDAALANRFDLSSTGGMMVGFAHKDMSERGIAGPVNLMSWGSGKLKRVCRSSLAAEVQALGEVEQEVMFIRLMWQEILGATIDLKNTAAMVRQTAGVLVTDAKALYDAAMQGDLPSFSMKEKYTALELLSLVQQMDMQKTQLRWCNSNAQLADGMTKVQAQDRIRKFLEDGQRWNLVYDDTFTAAKKLHRRVRDVQGFGSEEKGSTDPSFMELLSSGGQNLRGM